MSEQTFILFCSFGAPLVLLALIAAAVGFILRRVRPDLYMSDEEKEQAERRLERESAGLDSLDTNDNNDNNKENI